MRFAGTTSPHRVASGCAGASLSAMDVPGRAGFLDPLKSRITSITRSRGLPSSTVVTAWVSRGRPHRVQKRASASSAVPQAVQYIPCPFTPDCRPPCTGASPAILARRTDPYPSKEDAPRSSGLKSPLPTQPGVATGTGFAAVRR